MTPERWFCVYSSRTGTTAHAVFGTKEEALGFGERHSHAAPPSGLPIKWENAGDASVLPTLLGDYLITPDLRRNA